MEDHSRGSENPRSLLVSEWREILSTGASEVDKCQIGEPLRSKGASEVHHSHKKHPQNSLKTQRLPVPEPCTFHYCVGIRVWCQRCSILAVDDKGGKNCQFSRESRGGEGRPDAPGIFPLEKWSLLPARTYSIYFGAAWIFFSHFQKPCQFMTPKNYWSVYHPGEFKNGWHHLFSELSQLHRVLKKSTFLNFVLFQFWRSDFTLSHVFRNENFKPISSRQ